MEKYLVPKASRKDGVTTESGTSHTAVDIEENTGSKKNENTRVYDDVYYEKRCGVEAYMEGGGEYEEFESVVKHCREDLKKSRRT